MPTTRLLLPIGILAATAASCHAVHPLEIAEACKCSPHEYCHVRPASSGTTTSLECLPIPQRCPDPPSCACLGQPIDACREELGAFTVLEPRAVATCEDCAKEEYCWRPAGTAAAPVCRLIPARCEATPTCACLEESRQRISCNALHGRLEAAPVRTESFTE